VPRLEVPARLRARCARSRNVGNVAGLSGESRNFPGEAGYRLCNPGIPAGFPNAEVESGSG